jgi:hypothetical protein
MVHIFKKEEIAGHKEFLGDELEVNKIDMLGDYSETSITSNGAEAKSRASG